MRLLATRSLMIALSLILAPHIGTAQAPEKPVQTPEKPVPLLDPATTSRTAKDQSTDAVLSPLASGPMVAFGGVHEVTLWAQTRGDATVRFHYWPLSEPSARRVSVALKTHVATQRVAQVTLSGLKEATRFGYEVEVNGEVVPRPYPLQFQTQLRWQRRATPPDFTAAVGSCVYANLNAQDTYGGGYEIFESIRKQSPDLMLWLGDNLYLGPEDWSSREGIFRRYAAQRALPSLQALLGSVHHYAIWDDHDYGPNDANRSYPLKGVTLEAFKRYWPNPNFGLPELDGAFGLFSWSDVDFFLLDDRTFRAPGNIPNHLDKPLLGDAQLLWLLDALSNSRARFKIIAIGSQVLNPFSRFEGYAQHPRERERLIQGIKERRVEGVIFLSGDRHFAELNRRADDPQFYPLYDFTSSPLTSGLASSVGDEINNPLRVKGTLVNDRKNFGLLRFTGEGAERAVTLEAHDPQGALIWRHKIYARDLVIPQSKQH